LFPVRPTLPTAASGIGQVPHLRRSLTMIMSRRTAKNLNWAGAVVLACLGLALLPVPVRAQQPTPDNVVPIQVQPAKKTPMSVDEQIEALRRVLQQLEEQKRKEQGQGAPSKPANPDKKRSALQDDLVMRLAYWSAFSNEEGRRQAIEALNRILEMLQKQGQGASSKPANQASPWPANWKEINKAIEEVNRLMHDAEDKRAALREAEIRLRQAHAEVEKLRGKSAGSRGLPSNVVPVSPR
jgi:hypothetical protein